MITPRTRAIVSLAATLTAALALGACARSPARPGPAARADVAALAGRPATIRFDNGGRERVLVYLVGEQREWLLGRVEPGARATLRLPRASLAGSPGLVRLAVLAGERLTLQAARDPRATVATTTIAQPVSTILSQRWTFAQGQLTSLWGPRTPAPRGRP
jgi:hypothetical protein